MNTNIDYGYLLSKAWQITWKNKWLWLLGFLVGLGGGSSVNFQNRFNTQVNPNNPTTQLPPEVRQMLEQFRRPEVQGIVITLACVILLLALVLFVLRVIARGGLIGGIRLADDNGQVGLGEAWAVGVRYFWRMLGLEILQALPVIVLVILLVVGFIFFGLATAGIGVFCLLPIICVMVILLIPYNLVFWLAGFGLVVEGLGVFDSVKRGWEVLKANLAPVLIVGVILFILLFIVGLVTLIPIAAIALPAFFAFMGDPQHPNISLLVGSGIAFLCLLPFLWLFTGILTTWVYSVWTLLYSQLIGRAPQVPSPQAPVTPLPQTS